MKPHEIDPEGFERRLSQYVEWLKFSHFSERTAEMRDKLLRPFFSWAVDRGLTRPAEVTKAVLERYQAHLFHHRKENGEPLAIATQQNVLMALRGFFRWLARQNHILYNPSSELMLPRLSKRLPRHVLTVDEVERVIAMPDVKIPTGLRDRAILELLYSSGLRRMEAVSLKLYDLDRDRGTLVIRHGKGRHQRVVPVGERALRWIDKYLYDVRPLFIVPPDEGWIFLTHHGNAFEMGSLSEMVRVYVERAEIPKHGSVHLFRHTMATHLLEGGADIRYIQAILGHSKLETTTVYTHVAIRKLQEAHAAAHPAEKTRKVRKEKEREKVSSP